MARSRALRLTALTIANALLPVALVVFARGFFPYKPLLPGLATFEDTQGPELWSGEQPEAAFDRVIFMVVDALRSDFVYGYKSGFEFTQSLIRNGAAIPFTAHATPPTVTMPRVKALTTGSVPSFADLIFNLDESGAGSSLATQDTWLAQIRARGGKLVFYGDDTWLRLFPGDFFERADGTSSFFVSDFVEVDNNVTRHVPDELRRDDWDAMIMHYLGLDHIGHKTGPNGPKMLDKQREMDGIVRQIYEAMETEQHLANTLLVLAGDHGMSAGGNHGGSGPGETEPALVFASPKLKKGRARQEYQCPTAPDEGTDYRFYRKIQQSDLVPTLAGLMGLPISKNSLGVFARELAAALPAAHASRILYRNVRQIKHIVSAAYGNDSFADLAEQWRLCFSDPHDDIIGGHTCPDSNGDQEGLARRWAWAESRLASLGNQADSAALASADGDLLDFLTEAQESLSNVASSYGLPAMVAGILLSTAVLALALASLPSLWPPSTAGCFFALVCLLYGIMMFASSYVEEEQHLWYWLTPLWFTLLTAKSTVRTTDMRSKLRLALAGATILAVHRVAVRWNQTGQKHVGEPDIVHTFLPQHYVLMWVLILATYTYDGTMLMQRTFLDLFSSEIAMATAATLVLPAIVFKLNFTQADAPELVKGLAHRIRTLSASFGLVSQAQLAFALLALGALVTAVMAVSLARGTAIARKDGPAVKVTLAERLHHLFTLFIITQTRAQNIPLFFGLEIQRRALSRVLTASTAVSISDSPRRNATISSIELATSALLLSHAYFFCMGGSNSVSSIDLSNAYNGVADYSVIAVGALLFTSNWAGPIYWCSAAVATTFSKPTRSTLPVTDKPNGSRTWVEEERAKLRREAVGKQSVASEAAPTPEHWLLYVSCMTVFVSSSLLAVMAACTALRAHLFIWTVFSPKYLYAMAWCAGWHLVVNIAFGGLLRWVGQIA